MTKEYTGPEFEIEFARADYEWKKAGKVGKSNPSYLWQVRVKCSTEWRNGNGYLPEYFIDEAVRYRWKPSPKRMVHIGYISEHGVWIGKKLVAPEVEAPAIGTPVYNLDSSTGANYIDEPYWRKVVSQGKLFLCHEDRDAMADWLAVCRRGGAT